MEAHNAKDTTTRKWVKWMSVLVPWYTGKVEKCVPLLQVLFCKITIPQRISRLHWLLICLLSLFILYYLEPFVLGTMENRKLP